MKLLYLACIALLPSVLVAQVNDTLYVQQVQVNTSIGGGRFKCGLVKGKIIVTTDSLFIDANRCKSMLDKRIAVSSIQEVKRAWWMIVPHTIVIKTNEERTNILTYRRRRIIQTIRSVLQ